MLTNIKIGITGMPGAGKTQVLLRVISMLEEEEEIKVGGMITEPIIENRRRMGFYIVDWLTKERKVFAHTSIDSKVMIGRYKVDVSVMETVGVPAILSAIEKSDLIVLDEVGKMELESEMFVKAVRDALDADKPLILTMFKKSRNPLLQDIRRRDDIRVLEVTSVNKGILPFKIVSLLKGEIL
jgi:nucleoside-triphosphatase